MQIKTKFRSHHTFARIAKFKKTMTANAANYIGKGKTCSLFVGKQTDRAIIEISFEIIRVLKINYPLVQLHHSLVYV